jgi:hypothetical protein
MMCDSPLSKSTAADHAVRNDPICCMLQVTMAISCNAGSFACTIVFRLHAHWQYILLAVKVMKWARP